MTDNKNTAPFAFDGLDRLFHEKARLGILTSLLNQPDGIGFTQLKELCGLTDGNLSRHVQVLEEAGMVELHKGYEGKRPHTRCCITDQGRLRFSEYLLVLEKVLLGATKASSSETNEQSNDSINQFRINPRTT